MFKWDLEKAEETDQIANICWIIEKAREFQKNIYFCFIEYSVTCSSLGLKWKLTFSSSVATAEFSKFAGMLSAAL